MHDYLQKIIEHKYREVDALKKAIAQDANHPLRHPQKRKTPARFLNALKQTGLSVIAEIKRRSPSKSHLADIQDPVELAAHYVQGGARAISVLTDAFGFGGELADLVAIRDRFPQVPILRKDFIVDAIQLHESVLAGADAVLFIVAVLGDRTGALLAQAKALGLDVLVEVHTQDELNVALACGADLIGINNRNLSTFEVDTQNAFDLRAHIPDTIVTVAESGIHHALTAKRYDQAGFDAVLVGESLVKSNAPSDVIASFMTPDVKICGVKNDASVNAMIQSGVRYIGIMCHPDSKRFVSVETGQKIARETKRVGGVPVAVCVNQTASEILALTKALGVDVVQLHGDTARAALPDLPASLRKIFVVPVTDTGDVFRAYDALIATLNPLQDIILYDRVEGGSGIPFDWSTFSNPYPLAYGIAGGLSPDNVKRAITLLRPALLDVSSGVEEPGAPGKSLSLIAAFMREARNYE